MNRTKDGNVCTTFRNWAELLMGLGRNVRSELRRGVGIEETANRLKSDSTSCQLALAFACSASLLQFRALVEDWPLNQILQEIGQSHHLKELLRRSRTTIFEENANLIVPKVRSIRDG